MTHLVLRWVSVKMKGKQLFYFVSFVNGIPLLKERICSTHSFERAEPILEGLKQTGSHLFPIIKNCRKT